MIHINQENEEIKNNFETVCLALVDLLDKEYKAAKEGKADKLAEINLQKSQYQENFQNYLFDFTLKAKNIPEEFVEHIDAVHKASKRNSAYLAGAIDGVSTLMRNLRRATDIATFTGLYNSDGSFKASEEAQNNIGKV